MQLRVEKNPKHLPIDSIGHLHNSVCTYAVCTSKDLSVTISTLFVCPFFILTFDLLAFHVQNYFRKYESWCNCTVVLKIVFNIKQYPGRIYVTKYHTWLVHFLPHFSLRLILQSSQCYRPFMCQTMKFFHFLVEIRGL